MGIYTSTMVIFRGNFIDVDDLRGNFTFVGVDTDIIWFHLI